MSNPIDDAEARLARTRRRDDLSEGEVVAAALRFVAREGAAKLTMRGLASELGLSSMASYHYVSSKTALFDLVADAVLAAIRVPESDLPWEDRLRQLLVSSRTELNRFPGVAGLLLSRTVQTPNMHRLSVELRGVLDAAGFDRTQSQALGESFTIYLFGRLVYDGRAATSDGTTTDESSLAASRAADHFEIGLDLLITGARERLRTSAGS